MTSRNKGQLKIGQSGSVVIGKEKRESSTKAKVGKSGPIIIGGGDDRKSLNEKQSKKEKRAIIKKKKQERQVIIKKKKQMDIERLKIISKDEHSEEENPIIVKFTRKTDEFNVLVQDNKSSGKPWYYGLEGNWWWGMTEDAVRMKIESEQALEDQKEEDQEIEDIPIPELEGQEEDQKIEDIPIPVPIPEIDSQHVPELDGQEEDKKIEDIPIPELQIRTVSEMIDQMTAQYDRDLPKDPERRVSYIYPLDSTHSFHIVAVNHIKYLKDKYLDNDQHIEIEEIDWSELSNIDWPEKRNVLIHPFLYPFASAESFIQNSKNFARLLAMKNKIGGFDVADSDKISRSAVDLINKIDLMMVPSNFVKDAYIKSGVTIPVEVLPHGVSDEFLSDDIDTDNKKILKLRKMKEKNNVIFVLYFLVHSPHRKGADLVMRVMKRIQKKFKNVYLVVKGKSSYFSEIRSICIDSWMSDNDLVALYDSCDICLSPSRGGGFELNALEAVSRGIPTLVPNGCCFLDLINYFIPVDISDKAVQPLPGNPIHTGFGCQVNMDDFETKLTDVINRLDHWKGHFENNTKEIRDKYTWRNTAKILDKHLRNHGFID